jgi:hypothetical protein
VKGGFMRKRNVVIVPLILLLLVGCAGLKATYDKSTPQQRTDLFLYGLNKSLGVAVDTGAAYVKAKNDVKVMNEWQTRIIPAMDACNKLLREFIIKNNNAGPSGITIAEIMATLGVRFNEIQAMMRAWGIEIKF